MEDDFVGFFKYEGSLVQEGYFDARKSAEALIGIDEIMRYFLFQISKELQEKDIEIPVRIRKGSWEALIPHSLSEWLITGTGVALTTYATTALKKIAENDFKDKGTKDVTKEVFKAIKAVIKIAIHLKSLVIKSFEDVKFKDEDGIILVGIQNENGELLYVPEKYLEMYKNCPEKLFSKVAHHIEPERELEIGTNIDEVLDNDDIVQSVKVGFRSKSVFYKAPDENELLFPELTHGMYIELDGHISRGNENANSIGFEYMRHILTCYPVNGNIKDYKDVMFTNSKIKGTVDRRDDDGNINEKKPKIRFVDLEEIKLQNPQKGLFD